VCLTVLGLLFGGCMSYDDIPDQSVFAPLEQLAQSDQAVARVYIAPTRGAGPFASHTWFVVKAADADTFDRWEVSIYCEGPYCHVQRNRHEPEEYMTPGVYILAELVGEDAEEVVEIINRDAPRYPCRGIYCFLPGPNCNTFAQWLLDQAGWDVELPPTALGKDAPVLCS
jgi:hypothetical protein